MKPVSELLKKREATLQHASPGSNFTLTADYSTTIFLESVQLFYGKRARGGAERQLHLPKDDSYVARFEARR